MNWLLDEYGCWRLLTDIDHTGPSNLSWAWQSLLTISTLHTPTHRAVVTKPDILWLDDRPLRDADEGDGEDDGVDAWLETHCSYYLSSLRWLDILTQTECGYCSNCYKVKPYIFLHTSCTLDQPWAESPSWLGWVLVRLQLILILTSYSLS